MGARILDWMKSNQAFVIGLVIGTALGGILGNLGWFLQAVK